MTPYWLFAAALTASAFGGVLGMAGGIFIVPMLTLLFGIDIRVAIGASIVSVIACSCASARPFLRERLVNIRLAVVLEVATTLGALTGVFLIGAIPVSILYGLFAVVLAVSAKQMLTRRQELNVVPVAPSKDWARLLRLHSSFPERNTGSEIPYLVGNVPFGLSLMYGAGLLSALLGIGSGVLKIPAMDAALRLPLKVSSATSNFMIGVTAAASAAAYFIRGDIDMAVACPVALGSVVGSLAGARMLLRVPSDKLRNAFVIVLSALAVQMLLSAFGLHLVPGGKS